jgi:hypothetical protein
MEKYTLIINDFTKLISILLYTYFCFSHIVWKPQRLIKAELSYSYFYFLKVLIFKEIKSRKEKK